MILTLFYVIELSLAALLLTLLYLHSVVWGIVFTAVLALVLTVWNPALLLYGRLIHSEREVRHGKLPPAPDTVIPVRPCPLSVPEALRLLEGAGLLSSEQARTGALGATLLSLNCRGAVGWKPLTKDGDAGLILYTPAPAGLTPWESRLCRMLRRCCGKKNYMTLSEFAEYTERHPNAVLRDAVAFDRLVTEALHRKKYFLYKKEEKKTVTVLSRRGARDAVLMRAYYRQLADAPVELDSYPADMPRFAGEVQTLLCDALGIGIYEQMRDRLLADYVFRPEKLWEKDRIFSCLHRRDNITPTEIARCFRAVIRYGEGHGLQK